MNKKLITQERILQTLNRINEIRSRKTKADGAIIRALSSYGMKELCGGATSLDTDKLKLESTYLEMPKTREGFELILDRWDDTFDKYNRKRDRVWQIQKHHGISGLVNGETKLGESVITHPEEDWQLPLVESDLATLDEYKPKLFKFWVDHVLLNNLTPYKHIEESWQEISIQEIQSLLPFFQWAKIWESIDYFSQSRLEKFGCDQVRSEPKYPDDKKHHEVSLTLGRGLNMESPEEKDVFWVCACNSFPRN